MALHVVKVYVMCACRGHICGQLWAVKSSMKERAREEEGGGRNGFDEHPRYKAK
jgi:hypothetical protein